MPKIITENGIKVYKNHYCIHCGERIHYPTNKYTLRSHKMYGVPKHNKGHASKPRGFKCGKLNPMCGEIPKSAFKIGVRANIKGEFKKGQHPSPDTEFKKGNKLNRGKNNPGWLGGISFLPYCHKFNNKLKERVRKRDNYTCQRCEKTQKEELKQIGRKLTVHHIHFDKENCYPDLITLCTRCNFAVNHRRNGSEKRFMKNLKKRNLLNWC